MSMPSKLILMKYVLRAMPTFYLMLLDFTAEGYKELEAICRQFCGDFRLVDRQRFLWWRGLGSVKQEKKEA